MDFAFRVAGQLSASNRTLDARTLERLRDARRQALAAHAAAGQGEMGAALLRLRARLLIALSPAATSSAMALIVLAIFLGGGQWSSTHRTDAVQAVDTALLIDDLPIDAYLDPEFRAWLARESRS